MSKYICPRCLKDFKQKSRYEKHLARKTPCQNNGDKSQEIVNEVVEDMVKKVEKDNKNQPDYIPLIKQGDVIDELKKISNLSIDCIITSPPYWSQRDYNHSGQWGDEHTVLEYIQRMNVWANECKRVLKDEGSLFLNIGDKYDKKSLLMLPERLCINMCENGWVLRNKIIWYKPNHQPSGVKDRFTNTWEYIFFFTKDSGKYFNFKYYQNIDSIRIQHKNQHNGDIEGFPDILTCKEYTDGEYDKKVLEYNNSKNYSGKYVNQTKNLGGSAGARKSQGLIYSLKGDTDITASNKREIHEYLKSNRKNISIKHIDQELGYKDKAGHWFRTDPGGSLPKPEDWVKLKKILNFDDKYDKIMTQQKYILQNVKNNPKGKNPGDVWEIPLKHTKDKHFAQFPIELPNKIIKAFCPENGIVLDTFAGSGTTGLAAQQNNVQSIMIELNCDFCNLMKTRFSK